MLLDLVRSLECVVRYLLRYCKVSHLLGPQALIPNNYKTKRCKILARPKNVCIEP
jgi:hypothetical protein